MVENMYNILKVWNVNISESEYIELVYYAFLVWISIKSRPVIIW